MRLHGSVFAAAIVAASLWTACGDDDSATAATSSEGGAATSTSNWGGGGEGGSVNCGSNCNIDMPICVEGNQTCVMCLVDADCPSGDYPQCQGIFCVPCDNDVQCAGRIGTEKCDIDGGGACVQCVTSADCTGTDETCASIGPEKNTCVVTAP